MDLKLSDVLKEKYNPEGSELRVAQLRMVEILDYIVEVCRENGLVYWLCGGTMLGAVRHGGFIPWDDDLDIEMPRKDYRRLMKIFRKELPPYYEIHSHSTDHNYILLFNKLRDKDSVYHEGGNAVHWKKRGCFVDIFAMEPSSRKISDAAYWWYSFADRFMARGYCRTADLCYRLFKGIIQPIARFCSLFTKKEALYQPLGKYRNNPRYLLDIYPLGTVEFEGKVYSAPANPDGYLRQIFGDDYMKLPEEINVHTRKIEVYPHEEI